MSLLLKNNHSEHVRGNPAAIIEWVEYGDFQCGHCGDAYLNIRNVQKSMGHQIKFAFRHYPMISQHPLAIYAAAISELAARHNKFWEMHDRLFENQKYLSRSAITGFAEEIGLDTREFFDCNFYKQLLLKVQGDLKSGNMFGVNGTPTFFFNGKKYNGSNQPDSLLKTCKYIMEINMLSTH